MDGAYGVMDSAKQAPDDGKLNKMAVIAGIVSLLAAGLAVFLCLRGSIHGNALTGPVVKNTYVSFGRCVQDGSEPESIVWLVAEVQHGQALLISQKILDWRPFCDNEPARGEQAQWSSSSLREYLNNDFYNASFTEEEKSRILVSRLKNLTCPFYSDMEARDFGPETDDKIFVPSYYELNSIKPMKSGAPYRQLSLAWREGRSRITRQAIKEGARRDVINYHLFKAKTNYPYWLRTAELNGWDVMQFCYYNSTEPKLCTEKCGVRPALRIKVK